MESSRRDLAEMNKNPFTWKWSNTFTLRREYHVGLAGRRGSGKDLHVLYIERVIEDHTPPDDARMPRRPGQMTVGSVFSASASCGVRNNGQFVAQVVAGKDTKDVTCKRCLKRFGWEG